MVADHAALIAMQGSLSQQTDVGVNYSFMDLQPRPDVKSCNKSEYVIFGIYNFAGALKGWRIADFFGVSTSPTSKDIFVQNRLGIKYAF